MELRLFVNDDAPLSFVEPLTPPAAAPNARPWLTSVGDLTLHARAGAYKDTFSNPNATVTFRLDNARRQASALLGQPLRVRGELWDGATLYFAGLVQSLGYGTALEGALEA